MSDQEIVETIIERPGGEMLRIEITADHCDQDKLRAEVRVGRRSLFLLEVWSTAAELRAMVDVLLRIKLAPRFGFKPL